METQLKTARSARGWSQLRVLTALAELGALRGVPMPTRESLKTQLSRWENGHVAPQEPYCSLLAEVYGVAPVDLGLPSAPGPRLPGQRRADGVLGPTELTAESVGFMGGVLAQYARADNAIGPRHLLHVASQHVAHLEPMLVHVRGDVRRGGLRLCSRFAEFAGWICQDAGDLDAAQHWTDRALDYAEELDDPEGRAYVLMRKSAVAAERQEHDRSLSLSLAACRDLDRFSPKMQALSLRQKAVLCALARDARASERAAGRALDAVADVAAQGVELAYCTPAYIRMESGVSAFYLRRYDSAAEQLAWAAAEWPDGFARDRGLCLAWLAVVEAVRGHVDVACAVGRDALVASRVADSARTRSALVSLRGRLAPYDRVAFVSDFRQELARLH